MSKSLKEAASQLPTKPGVYIFKNAENQVIYVGKAKVLRSRVSQYFQKNHTHAKTEQLVSEIKRFEFFQTPTATDALILENELIKSYRPRYNIALKDDKSYPYLQLSTDPFPRLSLHRGKKHKGQKLYGPYPNAYAAKQALVLMQKLFQIRDCANSQFANRSRPCMQYQIKRCSAPCVNFVNKGDYDKQIQFVKDFLNGRSKKLLRDLSEQMDKASAEQAYEKAALYRDAIGYLRDILFSQTVEGEGDMDLWFVASDAYRYVLQLMRIRGGKIQGIEHEVFEMDSFMDEQLATWILGYYQSYPLSSQIQIELDVNIALCKELMESLLRSSPFLQAYPAEKAEQLQIWQDMARRHLEDYLPFLSLEAHDYSKTCAQLLTHFTSKEQAFRLECFDISHTSGVETMASCCLFDANGIDKRRSRTYLMKEAGGGDDYAAMREVLSRRVKALEADVKVVWLIDGGKGQIRQAHEIAKGVEQIIGICSIAKGPTRRPENEKYYIWKHNAQAPTEVFFSQPVTVMLQRLRDEAHNRAIRAHRKRRDRQVLASRFDQLPGVGPKLKKAMLAFFGHPRAILEARVDELAKVPGIGAIGAEKIYRALHGDD